MIKTNEFTLLLDKIGISKEDLCGGRACQDVSFKKKMVYYILREKYGMSYKEIGDMTDKDPSTIITCVATMRPILNNVNLLVDIVL